MNIAPPNPFHRLLPNFQRLYIFGAGGFGREVAWLAEQALGDSVELVFLVDQPEYMSDPINGIPVQLLSEINSSIEARFVIALGNPARRRIIESTCRQCDHLPTTLIHPRAEISQWVKIGNGSILCAGVIITTNVNIEPHVHINLDCTIGHDVSIGEFSTLSPGVHVSGNVQIGCSVFIGTGACIINGKPGSPLLIGNGAVIAAGACVTGSVDAGALVAGVPATRKR